MLDSLQPCHGDEEEKESKKEKKRFTSAQSKLSLSPQIHCWGYAMEAGASEHLLIKASFLLLKNIFYLKQELVEEHLILLV